MKFHLSHMLAILLLLAPATAQALPLRHIVGDPFKAEAKAENARPATLSPGKCPALPASGEAITFGRAVALALCHNTETRAAYLSLLAQANTRQISAMSYLPDVRASTGAGATRVSRPGQRTNTQFSSATLNAGLTLYDFGQREASVEAAEQSFIAATYGYDSTLQGVIAQAMQGYYRLLSTEGALEAAQLSERFARESLKAARIRFEIGQAPRADVLQAETSASQAQLAREQAEHAIRLERAAYANVLGMQADASYSVQPVDADQMTRPPLEGRVNEWMEKAKANRVDLKSRQAQLRGAEASYDALQRADLPSIRAQASKDWSDWDIVNRNETRSSSVGISVSIPLFSGLSQHYAERAAGRDLESQRLQYRQAERDIMQDVFRAWEGFEAAAQAYNTTDALVKSATQVRDISLGRYREGLGTVLDVINAQAQYSGALQSRLQAQTSLLTARVDLVRAVGLLDAGKSYEQSAAP